MERPQTHCDVGEEDACGEEEEARMSGEDVVGGVVRPRQNESKLDKEGHEGAQRLAQAAALPRPRPIPIRPETCEKSSNTVTFSFSHVSDVLFKVSN